VNQLLKSPVRYVASGNMWRRTGKARVLVEGPSLSAT
jgi:hypothetical protein